MSEAEKKAVEYKFWVIDKIGEILTRMKKEGELSAGNPEKLNSFKRARIKTLKELGISETASSRYQAFHNLPNEEKITTIQVAKKRIDGFKEKTIEQTIDEYNKKNGIGITPIDTKGLATIYNRDFSELNVAENSIDFILTDPPWSLNEHLIEWQKLGRVAAKVLKESAIMITYVSHRFMFGLESALVESSVGAIKYWNILCIVLNSNRSIAIDGYFEEWRPALIFCKGKWKHKEPCTDLIDCDAPEKRYHIWGQGVSAAEQIIRFHSKPNDLLFEPFAGGGSFIEAAINQGRNIIACERDPKAYAGLKQRFPEACRD